MVMAAAQPAMRMAAVGATGLRLGVAMTGVAAMIVAASVIVTMRQGSDPSSG